MNNTVEKVNFFWIS